MNYTPVIGLEIHAELKTRTKIFCSCKNEFGGERNTHCCPVCAGLPGALPVLNREAVEMAVAAGLTLGSEIAGRARWDRKNYFYPDLPKGYQISELYAPLCLGGGLELNGRLIRLNHIHLEEDAGKLLHQGNRTLLDFNRAGVPLIEIVTEPDLRSAEEAAQFVERVRLALVYAGVCDGKMEQGSLRCDANISVMPEGSAVYGTRTEIKNLNSFRFIRNALEFEIARQSELLREGGAVTQETRRYDDESGETFSMRSKENAHDYRYFPDPDIPGLELSREDVERIAEKLPEPPEARRARYEGEFGLSPADADTILSAREVSDFFDACVKAGCAPKAAGNLLRGEILRLYNLEAERGAIPIDPRDMRLVLEWAAAGKLSSNGLKEAVCALYTERCGADEAVRGLLISQDEGLLAETVQRVLDENPKAVGQYRSGDQKVFGFLMGQASRELKGKALPQAIAAALREALEKK